MDKPEPMSTTRPTGLMAPGMSFSRWWTDHVVASVDQRAVVDKVQDEAGLTSHFAVMTLLSAGIAVLGLLLSSPAVVIGAMLISPLMGPIIGLGFAIATFDGAEIRRSGTAIAAGVVLAVAFCAFIVVVSPLQTVTTEIASRTRPNLFDLLVALFSGLAGTYAMIRGRHGTIVGVAIATALMPPLAVIGFGIATRSSLILAGSTLLFFTNLMTIAAAAAVLARLYGFAPNLSPTQTRLQAFLIVVALSALAVPLALSLRQIAWETLASRETRQAIVSEFPANSRVNELDIDYRAIPVEIAGTVLTPQYRDKAEQHLRERLPRILRKPVILNLDQIRTAHGPDGASQDASSITSAAERAATRVSERLALIAGVPVENVLVDRRARRAFVRGASLPGADLSAYRTLEMRVAASASNWSIALVPPPVAPPAIAIEDDEPDQAALETVVWGARRLRLPVAVSGSSEEAEKVAKRLREQGVSATVTRGPGRRGVVAVRWATPGTTTAGSEPQR